MFVQEFLKNNSLQDLSITYNVQYNICESLGIVALNYSNLSPLTEDIVKECRCLFLELDTWNVVCKSMNAFFENYDLQGQVDELSINWENAKLIEKLDGALITLYFYKDEWRIGMRMCADASNKVTAINGLPTELTFAELTKLTIQEMGYEWEDYTSRLDKNIFYSFELCAPETRCGVIYNERKIVLVAAINRGDLSDVDIYSLDFPKEKPNYFPVSSLDEVFDINSKHTDPLKYEGFILLDGNYKRIKYKNPEYILMMSDPEGETELQSIENLLSYVLSFSSPGGSGGYSSRGAGPYSSMSSSGPLTPSGGAPTENTGGTYAADTNNQTGWYYSNSAEYSAGRASTYVDLTYGPYFKAGPIRTSPYDGSTIGGGTGENPIKGNWMIMSTYNDWGYGTTIYYRIDPTGQEPNGEYLPVIKTVHYAPDYTSYPYSIRITGNNVPFVRCVYDYSNENADYTTPNDFYTGEKVMFVDSAPTGATVGTTYYVETMDWDIIRLYTKYEGWFDSNYMVQVSGAGDFNLRRVGPESITISLI